MIGFGEYMGVTNYINQIRDCITSKKDLKRTIIIKIYVAIIKNLKHIIFFIFMYLSFY